MRPLKPTGITHCLVCQGELTREWRNANRTTCSDICRARRAAEMYRRRRPRLSDLIRDTVCVICDHVFGHRRAGRPRLTCGAACALERNRRMKRLLRRGVA